MNHLKHTYMTAMRGSQMRKRYDKLEKAIRAKATLMSELEFHRNMSTFYTNRVMDINPHESPTKAWDFADSKQKQWDHQEDFVALEKKVAEADARVEACTKAFKAAQQEYDAIPSPFKS